MLSIFNFPKGVNLSQLGGCNVAWLHTTFRYTARNHLLPLISGWLIKVFSTFLFVKKARFMGKL